MDFAGLRSEMHISLIIHHLWKGLAVHFCSRAPRAEMQVFQSFVYFSEASLGSDGERAKGVFTQEEVDITRCRMDCACAVHLWGRLIEPGGTEAISDTRSARYLRRFDMDLPNVQVDVPGNLPELCLKRLVRLHDIRFSLQIAASIAVEVLNQFPSKVFSFGNMDFIQTDCPLNSVE